VVSGLVSVAVRVLVLGRVTVIVIVRVLVRVVVIVRVLVLVLGRVRVRVLVLVFPVIIPYGLFGPHVIHTTLADLPVDQRLYHAMYETSSI
jgi:hypothetical protein